jgi:hypothetical protein
MKKAKSTKKFKGTRYVANVLRKYFKRKYPTYTAALPKAREVYAQLKSEGKKVTVANVESLIRKKRGPNKPKTKAPELFYKLQQAAPYFELIKYPAYILTTTNQITFTSNLFNEGITEIKGGQKTDYRETFQEFVNFCNKMHSEQRISDSQEIQVYVVCTAPEQDKQTKEWVSRIISVNDQGLEEDFGFIPGPLNVQVPYKKSKQPKQETQPSQKPQLPASPDVETLRIQAELEKTRQENIGIALDLFRKGQISKLEMKEMMNIIYNQ